MSTAIGLIATLACISVLGTAVNGMEESDIAKGARLYNSYRFIKGTVEIFGNYLDVIDREKAEAHRKRVLSKRRKIEAFANNGYAG